MARKKAWAELKRQKRTNYLIVGPSGKPLTGSWYKGDLDGAKHDAPLYAAQIGAPVCIVPENTRRCIFKCMPAPYGRCTPSKSRA